VAAVVSVSTTNTHRKAGRFSQTEPPGATCITPALTCPVRGQCARHHDTAAEGGDPLARHPAAVPTRVPAVRTESTSALCTQSRRGQVRAHPPGDAGGTERAVVAGACRNPTHTQPPNAG
jgi:hypothetical protein